jgi:putative hydrolase of the HAD superfamily
VSRARTAFGFDLDDTLFDHRGAAERGAAAFFAAQGIVFTPELEGLWFEAEKRWFDAWRTGEVAFAEQRRARLRDVLPAAGLATPADDAGLDGLFEEYRSLYRAEWRAHAGAVELLEELRASGARIGILTNGDDTQQHDKLERTGLLPLVDVVCASGATGLFKPQLAAFEHLAAQLGVARADVLFVGDDPELDVAGARAAGMRAALVAHRRGVGLRDALATL